MSQYVGFAYLQLQSTQSLLEDQSCHHVPPFWPYVSDSVSHQRQYVSVSAGILVYDTLGDRQNAKTIAQAALKQRFQQQLEQAQPRPKGSSHLA